MRKSLIGLVFCLPFFLFAQSNKEKLAKLNMELSSLQAQQAKLEKKIEGVKLGDLQDMLQEFGLPKVAAGEELVNHQAMSLVYSEEHEQAKWVAHIILPDILAGKVGRSNDFRIDPLVSSGSAVEADYFLKTLQEDNSYEYDGFGYDRGHLAPSADFRWCQDALSESYFYSNMSPQYPDFNRGIWANLEGKIRGYIFRNPESKLYVVTGPVLEPGLPKVERGVNKVSIPKQYFKVVIDKELQKGIAFLVPNEKSSSPLTKFMRSIDEVEQLTGLDFFHGLEDGLEASLESQKVPGDWIPESEAKDVDPIFPPSLPKGHFNTTQAKLYMDKGEKVSICGKVVATRTSRKGNILLNLDRQYPNQVFTVFILKKNIPNFSYDVEAEWKDKYIKVTSEIGNLGGKPTMFIEKEKQLEMFSPPSN